MGERSQGGRTFGNGTPKMRSNAARVASSPDGRFWDFGPVTPNPEFVTATARDSAFPSDCGSKILDAAVISRLWARDCKTASVCACGKDSRLLSRLHCTKSRQ